MQKYKLFIIGKRSNLSRKIYNNTNCSYLISSKSLNKLDSYLSNVKSCDIIYNLFYNSSSLNKRNSPEELIDYCMGKLAKFVSICQKKKNIKKIIFTSSSSVYGNSKQNCTERQKVEILNLNSSLKLASEIFLKEHLSRKVKYIIVARLFNMYGGDDTFSIISKIERAFKFNMSLILNNQGNAIRDFIHVNDVVAIYKKLLDVKFNGTVNVGRGIGNSVKSVIKYFENTSNKKLYIKHINSSEIKKSVSSNKKLISLIGNYKFISIKDFIKEKNK